MTANVSVQDQTDHEPRKRMRRLFESLYACLVRGGRAVLQIYPENAQQVNLDCMCITFAFKQHYELHKRFSLSAMW